MVSVTLKVIALFTVESWAIFISITIKCNVDARQVRVILSFSPKLPRTHVEFYCNLNKKYPCDSTVNRAILHVAENDSKYRDVAPLTCKRYDDAFPPPNPVIFIRDFSFPGVYFTKTKPLCS